ncbi:hypothetical protein Dimus_017931 [Dionaea muscipula]
MLVAHCLINKLAAFLYQESSILFAGRQVHPLFSQWKVGKSNPKNYDPESNCGMTIAKDKHFKFGPIDVLEDIKMASVGLAPTSALRESSGHGVDKLPQEMSDMKVREDKDMEPAIVDGNGMETGHIIVITILVAVVASRRR